MFRLTSCLAVLMVLVGVRAASADPIVPGFDIAVYANVTDPMSIVFDPAGNLYVGRDNTGSGGSSGDSVRIHRIGVGGSPVNEYGDTAIPDPDEVVYDVSGAISGTASSVLVGGQMPAGHGQIIAIRPDESVVQVFDLPASADVNSMTFDHSGRLLFTDNHNLFVTTGGTPTTLVAFGGSITVGPVVVDTSDRIYVSDSLGVIRRYNADGTSAGDPFTTSGSSVTIAFATGGGFGTDLYAVDSANGNLLRFDNAGNSVVVGTGFQESSSVVFGFGPDNALYVSDFSNDHILRVVPEPSTIALLAMGVAKGQF